MSMASRTAYSTWTPQKPTLFDGHYVRNRSTLDISVFGYIGIVQHKEHSPEGLSIPPGTRCIFLRWWWGLRPAVIPLTSTSVFPDYLAELELTFWCAAMTLIVTTPSIRTSLHNVAPTSCNSCNVKAWPCHFYCRNLLIARPEVDC